MKWSRIQRALSNWLGPQPRVSRATHTAYYEVFCDESGMWTVRIYPYGEAGGVLDEIVGTGGKAAAQTVAKRAIRQYRRKD